MGITLCLSDYVLSLSELLFMVILIFSFYSCKWFEHFKDQVDD